MRNTRGIIFAVLLTFLWADGAFAQWNVARFDSNRNRVYASFGLNPALVSSVGYGRVVSLAGHDFHLVTEAGVAAAHLDVNDYRARIGVESSIVRWRSLHLTGRATFITRGTKNSIYSGFNFGADLTGTVGIYRRGWFAAGEFGFDKDVVTHLTHSTWYKTYFYPEAKDGWYLAAGGTWHYGIVTGIAVGDAEIIAGAGFLRTEEFNDMLPPMYASLGLGFGF